MKKLIIAIVAVFAVGSMAMAQAEMNKTVKLNLNEEQTTMFNEYLAEMQQTEDFDLTEMKDFSFSTETGLLEIGKEAAGNDRIVGAILAIFLGDFGIHHFYSGDVKHGLWHLLFFWTGIPGLIGFIEGIIWLVDEGSYPKALFGGIL